jgi:fermentation-respiration switch protein FrsA (DUF1100 family)
LPAEIAILSTMQHPQRQATRFTAGLILIPILAVVFSNFSTARSARAGRLEIQNGIWVGGYQLNRHFHLLRLNINQQGGYLFQDESELPQSLLDLHEQDGRVQFRVNGEEGSLFFEGELEDAELRGRVTSTETSGDFILQSLVPVPVRVFDQYIGHYQVSPQREILVSRGDLAGQYFYWDHDRQYALYALSETEFLSERGERIKFQQKGEDGVNALRLGPFLEESTVLAPRIRPYRQEPVEFPSGAVRLSGNLLLPEGSGPYPAVILVQGSAASERYFYQVFASNFARNGMAALIYDQRGSGRSGGSPQEFDLEMLAGDVISGMAFLSSRPEIDATRIGLWGLSRGGVVIPMAAAKPSGADFLITLSAPAEPAFARQLWQVEYEYRQAQYPPALIDSALRLQRTLLDRRRLQGGAQFAGEVYDPLDAWKHVSSPVLLIYGGQDHVVPVIDSAAQITAVLRQQGEDNFAVWMDPTADHTLMLTGKDSPPILAPGLLDFMAAWAQSVVQGKAPGLTDESETRVFLPAPDFSAGGRYGLPAWHERAAFQLAWLLVTAGLLGAAFGLLLVTKTGLTQVSMDSLSSRGAGIVESLQALALISSMLTLILLGIYLRTLASTASLGQISSFDTTIIYRILPGFVVLPGLTLGLLILAALQPNRAEMRKKPAILRFLLVVSGTLLAVGLALYWT